MALDEDNSKSAPAAAVDGSGSTPRPPGARPRPRPELVHALLHRGGGQLVHARGRRGRWLGHAFGRRGHNLIAITSASSTPRGRRPLRPSRCPVRGGRPRQTPPRGASSATTTPNAVRARARRAHSASPLVGICWSAQPCTAVEMDLDEVCARRTRRYGQTSSGRQSHRQHSTMTTLN